MTILALFLALLIGISLGLLGGGGSILAVPILVYVAKVPAKEAIAMSLIVVGTTSLIGAMQHWRARNIDVHAALVFGIISMIAAYGGGWLARFISGSTQLIVFAVVMFTAAISMLRSSWRAEPETRPGRPATGPLVAAGIGVGTLTGLIGVGGGFLIVPALVLFAHLDIKRSLGTSLAVIAMNCVAAWLAYTTTTRLDIRFTALFTGMAIAGVFAGSALVSHVSKAALKRGFAIFLLAVAIMMLIANREALGIL